MLPQHHPLLVLVSGATSCAISLAYEPTSDEIALYDRQIRLWGMQAQERLRNANILLVNIKALGNEIAKNLVLAGIGSLTLVDNNIVTEDDLGAQFFISPTDIGKPRAEAAAPEIRKLNPRVTVHVSPQTLDTLSSDPTIFSPYDIVIATDLPITALSTLNAAARLSNRPFYAAIGVTLAGERDIRGLGAGTGGEAPSSG